MAPYEEPSTIPERITKKDWNDTGTGYKGNLIKAPAAVSAAKSGIRTVFEFFISGLTEYNNEIAK